MFQVDAGWESDPYCKVCGLPIRLEQASHFCCPNCANDLGMR